jgi:glycosyltransferase involved in cell wall biosynthesis
MRILVITPAPPGTATGNRVTAVRWARILRRLGHRVTLAREYRGHRADLLVALHARKSSRSIARFRRERPAVPVVVALTGTDLYADLRSSAAARRSLDLATRLVVLQPLAVQALPGRARGKVRVILQSAQSEPDPWSQPGAPSEVPSAHGSMGFHGQPCPAFPPPDLRVRAGVVASSRPGSSPGTKACGEAVRPHGLITKGRAAASMKQEAVVEPLSINRGTAFETCVLGHLRRVKDPFRTAAAARLLPPSSRIRVLHVGKAVEPGMAARARAEQRRNPRYRWLGSLPHAQARKVLARSRLLCLTSRLEGGANVLSEAAAVGVPAICSRIDGSVGLLGRGYPGYFPVGGTRALARLLFRAETDPRFYARLKRGMRRLARLVRPERECAAWASLLGELTGG